jgi:CheY-like chemotaxis protein
VSPGHEVVCVDNGAAALEAAGAGDYDVILMDVRMPVMNGLEATRRIRELPAPRGQVPVVAVTAQAFAQQIEMCREAGMGGHVAKPFKQNVLLATVENIASMLDRPPSANSPPRVAAADPEPEFPLFDRAMFEEITSSLSAAELTEHLGTLVTRCEALLLGLNAPGMPDHAAELVEETHRLAGGAGTFGFLSLAAAAREFEVAADSGASDVTAAADRIATEIKLSIPIISQQRDATMILAI